MQDNNVFIDWLSRRKISESVRKDFNIHWGENQAIGGECIVIPIADMEGKFSFNKYRRNPLSSDTPKYKYDQGGISTLYGAWKAKNESKVLLTEGEMDCLVAWSHQIPAVTGTGGAMTFKEEWVDFFKEKEIYICFDNDKPGGEGMAKVFKYLPWAKIVFLPDRPGIKDISDYVMNGGDLSELIKTARGYGNIEEIMDDRSARLSLWKSVHFHDAYIKENGRPAYAPRTKREGNSLARAKSFPIDSLIDFKRNKAECIWHHDPGKDDLHYYKDTNHVYCFGCGKYGDAIEVYRAIHDCSFMEAVKNLQ